MGNTISGNSGAGLPPPVDHSGTGAVARHRRQAADALHRQTLHREQVADAAAARAVFADAARQADTQGNGNPRIIAGEDQAARQPARFTISKVWENPARIAPDISGVPKSPHSALALDVPAGMDALLGVSKLEDRRVAAHASQIDQKAAATPKDAIVAIPQAHLEKAMGIAARLAVDNTVHVQDADGTYKVWTGPDAGKVRDLSSMIVGFTPRANVSMVEMHAAGREISSLLRQESVLLQMDSAPGTVGRKLSAIVTLDPARTPDQERALITALSAEFGGTTKIAGDKVAVIVDFSTESTRMETARATAANITTQMPGATGIEFRHGEAEFPAGVRIASPVQSKERFLAATQAEYRDRLGPRVASLMNRAEVAFDDTWQRLFGDGIRPSAKNYIMIDQKSRHLSDEGAPMHWTARAVSLNDDRTEIANLWTSELVMDTRPGNGLSNDPIIGRADFQPGTALVKDVGLASPSYAPLGTYTIPVKDANKAITQMKEAEIEDSTKNVKYHTEVPNCLSYALGLLKNAGPTELRHQSQLDSVFRAQIHQDTQPRARFAVATLGEGDTYSRTIPGLVTGDTNYPKTLAFLDQIADETMSHPSEADWKKAFVDKAGNLEHKRLVAEAAAQHNGDETKIARHEMQDIIAEVTQFQASLNPTKEEIEANRAIVMEHFNKGLRYEVYTDPKLDAKAQGPRLSELHNEVGLRDLATLPRVKSDPGLSRT
jgi:hypothetical protein